MEKKTLHIRRLFHYVRIIIYLTCKWCSNGSLVPLNMLNLGITSPFGASYLRITLENGLEVIPQMTCSVISSTRHDHWVWSINHDLVDACPCLGAMVLYYIGFELVDSHSWAQLLWCLVSLIRVLKDNYGLEGLRHWLTSHNFSCSWVFSWASHSSYMVNSLSSCVICSLSLWSLFSISFICSWIHDSGGFSWGLLLFVHVWTMVPPLVFPLPLKENL